MQVPQPDLPATLVVSSPHFVEGGRVPARFTCRGEGLSPGLAWSGVPAEALDLAVIVSDPDAPRGTYLHWLFTGLEPRDGSFGDGAPPRGAREFPNSARSTGWVPPCPPSGTHRYLFAVYALDAGVRAASSEDALAQIRRHVIAWGALTTLVSA